MTGGLSIIAIFHLDVLGPMPVGKLSTWEGRSTILSSGPPTNSVLKGLCALAICH